MVKRSKLLMALDAQKGRDYAAEKRKAQVKAAEKRKRVKLDRAKDESTVDIIRSGAEDKENDQFESFDEEDDETNGEKDIKANNGTTASANQVNDEVDGEEEVDGDDDDVDDEELDSDVPLSDLDADDLEDTIPHQRMTINNTSALIASRNRISLLKQPPQSTKGGSTTKIPFHIHNSLVSSLEPVSTTVSDPNDDLTRELEFYRIARTATLTARKYLEAESIPFTRPTDYFAEMVKTDEHMTRIKRKLYDDAAGKKASAEAKKLREAKKFGKQVQIAKEQERAKEKRETLDKIKDLKRKRKGNDPGKVRESDKTTGNDDGDIFESIAVESAPTKDRSGRERGAGDSGARGGRRGGSGGGSDFERQKRDQKFGFGGKKRFSKSGDALSSGDLSGFSAGRMKSGGLRGRGGGKSKAQRPGKSRRAAGAR